MSEEGSLSPSLECSFSVDARNSTQKSRRVIYGVLFSAGSADEHFPFWYSEPYELSWQRPDCDLCLQHGSTLISDI